MREAIKAVRRYMSASSWNGWILDEYSDFAKTKRDEIEQYARNGADTVNHCSGTVYMGKSGVIGKGMGALYSDLTMKGVKGLRVVDASAFVSGYDSLPWVDALTLLRSAFHSSGAYAGSDLHLG